jgi:hypothetical protein
MKRMTWKMNSAQLKVSFVHVSRSVVTIGAAEENSEDEEDSDGGYGPVRMPDAGGKNKLLANGYKNGLSYIARGKNIGVFRKTEDDQLEYAATISKVLTPQGKQFAPKKVCSQDNDDRQDTNPDCR